MGKPFTAMAAVAVAVALFLSLLSTPASAATFKCSGPQTTCTSLLGFPVVNATKFSTIAKLFNIPVADLLSANRHSGLSNVSRSGKNTTVSVPIPCTCSGGSGTSGNTTHYTVKKDDGLDHIARDIFGLLVVFQEIAKANNIPNPDQIDVNQTLTIPLPCSCDQVVPGQLVVHYAYKVVEGESIDVIANSTGASGEVIRNLNGIVNDKDLKVEQILDVPLKACGDTPSPLLAGTNLTSTTPCPAAPPASSPSAQPGSNSNSPPTGTSAARSLTGGFGWTPLVLLLAGLLHIVH